MTKSEQVLSLLDVDQFSIEVHGKTGLGLDYSYYCVLTTFSKTEL